MNDARQDPTTPSPRNAPPMTDRDRLEEISTAVDSALRTWAHNTGDCRSRRTVIADALHAAGVTLPPQPAGPVTSASTLDAARDVLHAPMFTHPDMALKQRYDFDHKVAPKIAEDHGLLTPAEVERRAREWVARHEGVFWAELPKADSLVAALTAPAATGTGVGK